MTDGTRVNQNRAKTMWHVLQRTWLYHLYVVYLFHIYEHFVSTNTILSHVWRSHIFLDRGPESYSEIKSSFCSRQVKTVTSKLQTHGLTIKFWWPFEMSRVISCIYTVMINQIDYNCEYILIYTNTLLLIRLDPNPSCCVRLLVWWSFKTCLSRWFCEGTSHHCRGRSIFKSTFTAASSSVAKQ